MRARNEKLPADWRARDRIARSEAVLRATRATLECYELLQPGYALVLGFQQVPENKQSISNQMLILMGSKLG